MPHESHRREQDLMFVRAGPVSPAFAASHAYGAMPLPKAHIYREDLTHTESGLPPYPTLTEPPGSLESHCEQSENQ